MIMNREFGGFGIPSPDKTKNLSRQPVWKPRCDGTPSGCRRVIIRGTGTQKMWNRISSVLLVWN